jgi:hypothetical protein
MGAFILLSTNPSGNFNSLSFLKERVGVRFFRVKQMAPQPDGWGAIDVTGSRK